jgi:hypothetical protein
VWLKEWYIEEGKEVSDGEREAVKQGVRKEEE